MKKIFAIIAVAALAVACNGKASSNTECCADSAAVCCDSAAVDSAAADSAVADSTVADSAAVVAE